VNQLQFILSVPFLLYFATTAAAATFLLPLLLLPLLLQLLSTLALRGQVLSYRASRTCPAPAACLKGKVLEGGNLK
jgi:hypothetical protein